ncbi:hypothetical protein E2C01_024259 [Portunus trituberculatus]|uniref:Uncharacterized protein n=1 Tax=Portunus trituberculatus TaxID=210409 RepID=A0A5B7ECB9_PORTR|nr:hypothetical protein [Portunus trituberculatus]
MGLSSTSSCLGFPRQDVAARCWVTGAHQMGDLWPGWRPAPPPPPSSRQFFTSTLNRQRIIMSVDRCGMEEVVTGEGRGSRGYSGLRPCRVSTTTISYIWTAAPAALITPATVTTPPPQPIPAKAAGEALGGRRPTHG